MRTWKRRREAGTSPSCPAIPRICRRGLATARRCKDVPVTVSFTSKAIAAGLSDTPLGTQTVHVTGNVDGYAVANTLGTPIDLGNIHAGDSFVAQNVSVQNVAPNTGYYENLEAAAGSWDVTILPGNSANLSAGIGDSTPGAKDVPVTVSFTSKAIAAGLSDTPLGTQTVHVTGNVYGYAVANTLGTPIDLGNIHAGDSFVVQNVSVQNVAPNTGYYENLEAAAGSWDVTILPGNSANLSAGIVDNTPGAKDVSVTVNFTSKAIAAGLSDTPLGTQTVHVTGNVYGYAVANTLGTPIDLGNIHAGDSFVAQNVSVQNVAPNTGYYENLEAAAGGWTTVIVPGDSANMPVNISDNTAGHKAVSVPVSLTSKAIASGLSDTALPTQTVTVTGNVYDYAVPAPIASPGNVGKVYTNTPVSRTLTVANSAPASSYSEGLNATFGAAGGGMTGVGLLVNLAGGDSNSAVMSVMLDTSSAGGKHGSAVVNFVSNGANSGLGDTDRGSQLVTMDADVYDHGVASFDAAEPLAVYSFVLSGSLNETVTKQYDIYNLLQTAGFTGKLDLTDVIGGGDTAKINSGLSTFVRLGGQRFQAVHGLVGHQRGGELFRRLHRAFDRFGQRRDRRRSGDSDARPPDHRSGRSRAVHANPPEHRAVRPAVLRPPPLPKLTGREKLQEKSAAVGGYPQSGADILSAKRASPCRQTRMSAPPSFRDVPPSFTAVFAG